MATKPVYGRKLADFKPGQIYPHPWDVTVDEGMLGLYYASFQDATPVFASNVFAQSLGFEKRPVHPLLLLNLGLSFSVHDVSEQAVAHLAYLDVRFPNPSYAGDTLFANSEVLGAKPTSRGDRGVVHVRTVVTNQLDKVVCRFERKALVRAGNVEGRPPSPWPEGQQKDSEEALPESLRKGVHSLERNFGFSQFYEDFEIGDVFFHGVGKTVGDSEHMQLTQLMRNTHPLHFDEVYCKQHSFAKTRVVYGGLVLAWVLSLTSRDLSGNALWEAGLNSGAHPAGVTAGDTLYASSRVIAKQDLGPDSGIVTLRVVGTKNAPGNEAGVSPEELFLPELKKESGKVSAKVVEIDRSLLIRKRPRS